MDEPLTHDQKLKKLREIIKAVDICMLTTVDVYGELHSRPMSNNKDVEFDGDLWFFTSAESLKVDEINRIAKVNASFADIQNRQYASLTGNAELVLDRGKIEELWKPQLRVYFPAGIDTPDIALLKISVEHAEYWDASQSLFSHAFSFLTALAKGQSAKFGENERIDLE